MSKDFKHLICHSIKTLRKQSGLNQYDFAEKCNVSYDSLRKWETNKNTPNSDNIDKICAIFGLTPIQLLLIGSEITCDCKHMIDVINAKLTSYDIDKLTKINNVIDLI